MLTTQLYAPNGSRISAAMGPSQLEQLNAVVAGVNWIVLGVKIFNQQIINSMPQLQVKVNALKHALQTYGPRDAENLSSLINNEGRAKGQVFHGHVVANGTTYVIEWAIVSEPRRIMTIVKFGTHENYQFRQLPLKATEIECIMSDSDNVAIMERTAEVSKNIREKQRELWRTVAIK